MSLISLDGLGHFLEKLKSGFPKQVNESQKDLIYDAYSEDGVDYTVSVPGITELYAGLRITVKLNRVSSTTSPTLNVNGLGAKGIRQPLCLNNVIFAQGSNADWLSPNSTVTLTYGGLVWKTDFVRSSASNLYGTVPINKGGTGATSSEEAIQKLGITPSAIGAAEADHSHDGYLASTGGSLSGNLNVNGSISVNGHQSVCDNGTTIELSNDDRQTMINGSQVYSKTSVIVSSDERLKENIERVDPDRCLEFINSLDIKTFNYTGNKTPCMGVIAQDLQDRDFSDYFVFTQPGEEKYLAVKASDLVFPLIAAVQSLSEKVNDTR